MGDDPDHGRAGRRAGDGGAHGRGHRQGAERSDPRGVRLPRDVLPDAGAGRHELRQRRWPNSPASRAASSCSASRGTSSCRSRRAVVWLLVVQGTYSSVEKIFLVASAFYVCYIVAGVLAQPDWKAAAFATVTRPRGRRHPQLRLPLHAHRPGRHDDRAVDAVLPAGVGRREGRDDAAVPRVALGRHRRLPVRRGRRLVHHRRLRGDAARRRPDRDRDAADAAQALRPLAGEYAYLLFAAGLFNASLFAASILPISTAYAVCEGLGFESGLDKKFHEAPAFYWLYTLLIVVGAGVLLVPRLPARRTSWCCRRSSTASCCRSS